MLGQTVELVIYENFTSLCCILYAHSGSKLRLVVIVDQPHLRNPFQIVCGVDLHTDRTTMTSMQMARKHDVCVGRGCCLCLICTVDCSEYDMMTSTRQGTKWHADILERHTRKTTHNRNTQVILTSWTFSLALMSDGCTREPITFRLPWMTRASSGRSVLMPTLPWW